MKIRSESNIIYFFLFNLKVNNSLLYEEDKKEAHNNSELGQGVVYLNTRVSLDLC